ncbi:MAG: NADPH-dependent reductase [Novosphingobium sp.]|nr:NADPH-dependent reductase [Novosphingobium sp.]
MTTIAIVVGSLRQDSFNRKFAEALAHLNAPGVDFTWPDIGGLPHYNQDADSSPVAETTALKTAIRGADGVIFVTPEYNRSIPGVLKNAIDLASRPYGDSAWAGKPAGIIGVSIGAIGTALAQQHLRNVLAYLDMPTLGQPEAFIQHRDGMIAEDGTLTDMSRDFVQEWLDTYLAFVARHG